MLVVRFLLGLELGRFLFGFRLYPRVVAVVAVARRARLLFRFYFPAPVFRLATARRES